MENTKIQLDISKTTPILTPSGGQVWQTGVILRQASKFLTGTPQDAIIPIDVFFDPITGKINRELLPTELKDFIND